MIQKSKSDMEKIEKIGYDLLNNIESNKNKIDQVKKREEEIKRILDLD